MNLHAEALAQIALVTNHFGDYADLAIVLQDWITFLGGKPGQVVVVDGGSSAAAQETAKELAERGLIDTLALSPPRAAGDNALRETAYVQEYQAGALAHKPYILFFHADTLPYRLGHDDWLPRALDLLERSDVFAISGAFNFCFKRAEAWGDWYWSDKCTLNFGLLKRELFMAATEEYAGDFIRSDFRGVNPAAAEGLARYVIELALEKYMARHALLTLVRHEDPTWSIVHTNVRGARLAQVRADFYARKNIKPFLDVGANPKHAFPGMAMYYGQPLPGVVKRARIRFGQTRVGPSWRALKKKMHLPF